VTRAIPFLASLVAAFIAFAGTGAQAASAGQAVGIVLQHNAAATERLPFYRTTAPVAVNVRGDASHLSAITVTAHAPDGTVFSAPLTRTGDTFTGALKLAQPGTWTLALSTQLGSMSAALADVPLQVVAGEDNADLVTRLTFALSALSICAGLTLLLRARLAPVRARV
jgi:hypothetical protein